MKLRINKLISDAGLGSRRDVEEYIRLGRVKINGRRAQLSDLVSETDVVFFDEVDLPVKELIQEHIAEEKLQTKLKKDSERPRTRDRRSERAESQRILSAPKSAALRKTSKNNPENKRAHKARTEGWGDEEEVFDERLLRHHNSGRRGSARTSSRPAALSIAGMVASAAPSTKSSPHGVRASPLHALIPTHLYARIHCTPHVCRPRRQ